MTVFDSEAFDYSIIELIYIIQIIRLKNSHAINKES